MFKLNKKDRKWPKMTKMDGKIKMKKNNIKMTTLTKNDKNEQKDQIKNWSERPKWPKLIIVSKNDQVDQLAQKMVEINKMEKWSKINQENKNDQNWSEWSKMIKNDQKWSTWSMIKMI